MLIISGRMFIILEGTTLGSIALDSLPEAHLLQNHVTGVEVSLGLGALLPYGNSAALCPPALFAVF